MTEPTAGTPISATWTTPATTTPATPTTAPPTTTPPTTAPTTTNDVSSLVGSWQVYPGQVSAFASAVAQVRSDLNAVFQHVDELTSPSYQPQLGSSPVGQALTAKFVDRLSGGDGLLSSLNAVLTHLDQFVSNAEQSAAHYVETEASTTDTMHTT